MLLTPPTKRPLRTRPTAGEATPYNRGDINLSSIIKAFMSSIPLVMGHISTTTGVI